MSTKKRKTPKKVKFFYEKPDDHSPIYVNGLYGGMTPKGELLCHFFYEYVDIPLEETTPISEKGEQLIDQIEQTPRHKLPDGTLAMKREIKTSVIIPAHQVRSFATWMINHLEKSGIEIRAEKNVKE